MEHEHKESQTVLGRNGKTAGCAACVSPKGNKHNVACLSRQEEWKSKIMLQSEHVRHADDTEGQTITHEASSSSTVSNPNTAATHNRDIDKQDGNDDSENPGEWTPANESNEIQANDTTKETKRNDHYP